MTVDTRQNLSIIHRPKSFFVNIYNFVLLQPGEGESLPGTLLGPIRRDRRRDDY